MKFHAMLNNRYVKGNGYFELKDLFLSERKHEIESQILFYNLVDK